MLDRDPRAADGGGEREAPGDGEGEDAASAAGPGAAEAAAAGPGVAGAVASDSEAEEAAESVSDSDSCSWTSSEAGGDLADDAVPGAAESVGVGVVPFGLTDPRRHLSPAPTFGNVAVANSTDVQFGNKTFFNGPVTIKQVVYAKDVEDAAATAVPAAGTGASVAHVDPAAPDKGAVVAEGVRLKVLSPVVVANGKAARANGAAASSTSSDSEAGTSCCQIPGFSGAGKSGEGDCCGRQWWRRLWKNTRERNMWLCTAAAILVGLGGIMSIASAVFSALARTPAAPPSGPSVPELPRPWNTSVTYVTLSGKLRVVPRREWLAQPRLDSAEFLRLPVPYVIVSHSATEACDTQAACTHSVRFLQTFHIESRGWSDIIYNFLVGGDGYVYEGRGWTVVGAHTFGYNNRSIGINMVGTFKTVLPPEAQMLALRNLIELGVQEGYVAEDYKLLGHRQLANTDSPGAALYEELVKWPHWSSSP